MSSAGRGTGSRTRGRAVATVVAVLLVQVAAGCADEAPPAPEPTTAGSTDLADATFWLSFEDQGLTYDGGTQFPDALGGPLSGVVETANGGTVEAVAGVDGRGDGLAFPERCDEPTGCPRAMVEVGADPALDPGTGDFEFGAAVWLAPDQTTTGSNLVQRGRFDTEGGLWKLQVDSLEGRPSCVVRSADQDPVVVRSSVSVADSTWHRVSCRRDATGIEIEVDGVVDREDGATGSVDSEWPLRIGSPGVGDADDQFHGQVDDVYVTIDPAT